MNKKRVFLRTPSKTFRINQEYEQPIRFEPAYSIGLRFYQSLPYSIKLMIMRLRLI